MQYSGSSAALALGEACTSTGSAGEQYNGVLCSACARACLGTTALQTWRLLQWAAVASSPYACSAREEPRGLKDD